MVNTWDYIKEIINYVATPDWFRWLFFSLLIVLLVWIRRYIARWWFRLWRRLDNIFKALATKDIGYWKLDIISDNQTYFTGYKAKEWWPNLALATGEAKIAKYQELEGNIRNTYKTFEELKNIKWIANRETITDEEAIFWWYYYFEKTFDLDVDKMKIVEAYLYIAVDDICKISINNNDIQDYLWEKRGITIDDALNAFDIKRSLKKWNNTIKFEVENRSFEKEYKSNQHFANKTDKWKDNPYWLKYRVYIKYIK